MAVCERKSNNYLYKSIFFPPEEQLLWVEFLGVASNATHKGKPIAVGFRYSIEGRKYEAKTFQLLSLKRILSLGWRVTIYLRILLTNVD